MVFKISGKTRFRIYRNTRPVSGNTPFPLELDLSDHANLCPFHPRLNKHEKAVQFVDIIPPQSIEFPQERGRSLRLLTQTVQDAAYLRRRTFIRENRRDQKMPLLGCLMEAGDEEILRCHRRP